MRNIALIAGLALAALAWAQEKPAPEATKPAAQEAPKPAPEAKASKASAKPDAMAKKHLKRNEDARRCLELEGNTAIIKCAEEYL